MSIIRRNYQPSSQNNCSKTCFCRKYGIQDTARVEVTTELLAATQQLKILIWTPADEDGNLYDVFEDNIVWSYQNVKSIIPLWTAIFKNASLFLRNDSFMKLFEL